MDAPQTDPEILDYILKAFPPELERLDQLAVELRSRNNASPENLADVEPVIVTSLWMRRVLNQARGGRLDPKAVFLLWEHLADELPELREQVGEDEDADE